MAWGRSDAAALLGRLLGEPVDLRHACPACGSDAHGRPWLRLRDGRRPGVSVAHAAGVTLVGVCWSGRLGVDLEPVAALLPPGVATLADWVRYEAHAKATGEGVRCPVAAGFEAGARFGVVDVPGFVAAWCLLRA